MKGHGEFGRFPQGPHPRGVFDPRTGTFVPIGDPYPFATFTVVEEGYDALLCTDRDGRNLLVAKPFRLRKTAMSDGIGSLTFSFDSQSSWTADDGVNPSEIWVVTPSYVAGEKILAVKLSEVDRAEVTVASGELTDIGSGDYLVEWEDASNRQWAVEYSE